MRSIISNKHVSTATTAAVVAALVTLAGLPGETKERGDLGAQARFTDVESRLEGRIGEIANNLTRLEASLQARPRPSPMQDPHNNGLHLVAVKENLARLEMSVEDLNQRLRDAVEASDDRPSANYDVASVDESHEQISPELILLEEQTRALERDRETDDYLNQMDQNFLSEVEDPRWKREAVDVIQRGLALDGLANSQAVDVDCRSSMCRLIVVHDDAAQVHKFLQVFQMAVSEVTPRMTMEQMPNDDGSVDTTIYLSRESD